MHFVSHSGKHSQKNAQTIKRLHADKKPAVCDISCQTISWPPARALYWLALCPWCTTFAVYFIWQTGDDLHETPSAWRCSLGEWPMMPFYLWYYAHTSHICILIYLLCHERLDIDRFKPLGKRGFLPFAVFNQLIHQCGKKCPVPAKVYSLTSCTPLPKAMKLAWAKKLSCWRAFVILTIQQCSSYIKLMDIVFYLYLLWMHFGHLRKRLTNFCALG